MSERRAAPNVFAHANGIELYQTGPSEHCAACTGRLNCKGKITRRRAGGAL
jgi:hypothetical protein